MGSPARWPTSSFNGGTLVGGGTITLPAAPRPRSHQATAFYIDGGTTLVNNGTVTSEQRLGGLHRRQGDQQRHLDVEEPDHRCRCLRPGDNLRHDDVHQRGRRHGQRLARRTPRTRRRSTTMPIINNGTLNVTKGHAEPSWSASRHRHLQRWPAGTTLNLDAGTFNIAGADVDRRRDPEPQQWWQPDRDRDRASQRRVPRRLSGRHGHAHPGSPGRQLALPASAVCDVQHLQAAQPGHLHPRWHRSTCTMTRTSRTRARGI